MKYNVGDKVRIKSIDWYNENKNNRNEITFENNPHWRFVANQSDYCGQIATVTSVSETAYRLEQIPWNWTDEMIEGLVEEEVDLIPKFGEYSDNEPLDVPTMTIDFVKKHGLPCPEDYIFKDENGNVINATKIILEKKKKEYPKTYEECCKVLGIPKNSMVVIYCREKEDYEVSLSRKLRSMQKFLICRDAYWKIAGEEMGLGKPWEPDWKSLDPQYIILYQYGSIDEAETHGEGNYVLAFPTKEMRDAFYENFKELIESCKELL